MAIDALLSRLAKVRQSGTGRWVACCPAHDDKRPSLSIRELDDGRVLLHCFMGCGALDVLTTLGLDWADLYPERLGGLLPAERRPFPAADVLRCIAFETLVVATAGTSLLANEPLTQADRDRLMLAVGRIQAAATCSGVKHG